MVLNELQIAASALDDLKVIKVSDQRTADSAQRLLQVRQCIMDRMMGAEEQKARMLRHEAGIEALEDRPTEGLKSYHIKDIQARIQLHKVKWEWCRQQIIQYELEMGVYRQMLIGDV